ncbi:MAG: chemotaxis protein CheW [Acidimicrobiales bacterium]
MSDAEDMSEIIAEFLVESRENLDRLDEEFVTLEQDPTSAELLGSIFRTVHTIKGTAAFLDFTRLEQLTHAGENLLSLMRDGAMSLDSTLTTVLLQMVDRVRAILDVVEAEGTDAGMDVAEMSARLIALANGDTGPSPEPTPAARPAETAPAVEAVEEAETAPAVEAVEEAETAPAVEAVEEAETAPAVEAEAPETAAEVEIAAETGDPVDEPGVDTAEAAAHESPGAEISLAELDQLVHELEAAEAPPVLAFVDAPPAPTVAPAPVPPAPAPAAAAGAAPAAPTAEHGADGDKPTGAAGRSSTETSIRVDVALLDRLMNLVSELVLARNQINQNTGSDASAGLQAAAQQLDIVTGDLQQALMETRMQPIGNLWNRLPRMIRDLATQLDKRVSLEMEGSETELDKTLLEAIRDPLTHIIRNAVDHGLEDAAARLAAGKPETGTVSLRARHEGGQVIVEISDDGAGLNLEAIGAKVVDRGLMSAEAVADLSERELANLVFLPGLSTAKAITKVSGRGVGMDVVKRSIDEIGGTIDIQTELGKGTVFTLRIPLTLAIIPALRVRCADERYLIPQLNVLELHRVDPTAPIELVGDTPLYRLRGELLPLLHWSDVLADGPLPAKVWTDKYIVVLEANGRIFGFVVDAVENTEEIVVKPLRAHLKDLDTFAGSTVLGDGSVALILDPIGITRVVDLQAGDEPTRGGEHDQFRIKAGHETVLVCTSGSTRIGFPLDGITRLESIPLTSIEHASGVEVVTYRGRLMRLVRLQSLLPGGGWSGGGGGGFDDMVEAEAARSLLVLVHESDDDVAGIVVDRIIEVSDADPNGSRPGNYPVRVSVLIDGRVTDVIDIEAVVAATRGDTPAMSGAW